MNWLQSRNWEVQTINIIIYFLGNIAISYHICIVLVCRGLPRFDIQQHKDITQWSSQLILCQTFLINTYTPRLELSEGHHTPSIAEQVASQRCSVLMGAFVPAPAHHQLKKHQLVAENLKKQWKIIWYHFGKEKGIQQLAAQVATCNNPNSLGGRCLTSATAKKTSLQVICCGPGSRASGCLRDMTLHERFSEGTKHQNLPEFHADKKGQPPFSCCSWTPDSCQHFSALCVSHQPNDPFAGPLPGCQETVHGCKPGVLLMGFHVYLGGCQVGRWWQSFEQKVFSFQL